MPNAKATHPLKSRLVVKGAITEAGVECDEINNLVIHKFTTQFFCNNPHNNKAVNRRLLANQYMQNKYTGAGSQLTMSSTCFALKGKVFQVLVLQGLFVVSHEVKIQTAHSGVISHKNL